MNEEQAIANLIAELLESRQNLVPCRIDGAANAGQSVGVQFDKPRGKLKGVTAKCLTNCSGKAMAIRFEDGTWGVMSNSSASEVSRRVLEERKRSPQPKPEKPEQEVELFYLFGRFKETPEPVPMTDNFKPKFIRYGNACIEIDGAGVYRRCNAETGNPFAVHDTLQACQEYDGPDARSGSGQTGYVPGAGSAILYFYYPLSEMNLAGLPGTEWEQIFLDKLEEMESPLRSSFGFNSPWSCDGAQFWLGNFFGGTNPWIETIPNFEPGSNGYPSGVSWIKSKDTINPHSGQPYSGYPHLVQGWNELDFDFQYDFSTRRAANAVNIGYTFLCPATRLDEVRSLVSAMNPDLVEFYLGCPGVGGDGGEDDRPDVEPPQPEPVKHVPLSKYILELWLASSNPARLPLKLYQAGASELLCSWLKSDPHFPLSYRPSSVYRDREFDNPIDKALSRKQFILTDDPNQRPNALPMPELIYEAWASIYKNVHLSVLDKNRQILYVLTRPKAENAITCNRNTRNSHLWHYQKIKVVEVNNWKVEESELDEELLEKDWRGDYYLPRPYALTYITKWDAAQEVTPRRTDEIDLDDGDILERLNLFAKNYFLYDRVRVRASNNQNKSIILQSEDYVRTLNALNYFKIQKKIYCVTGGDFEDNRIRIRTVVPPGESDYFYDITQESSVSKERVNRDYDEGESRSYLSSLSNRYAPPFNLLYQSWLNLIFLKKVKIAIDALNAEYIKFDPMSKYAFSVDEEGHPDNLSEVELDAVFDEVEFVKENLVELKLKMPQNAEINILNSFPIYFYAAPTK